MRFKVHFSFFFIYTRLVLSFGSECCPGSESMAASRVNRFYALIYQHPSRDLTGRKYRLSSRWYDPTGNRTQPTSFGAQPAAAFSRAEASRNKLSVLGFMGLIKQNVRALSLLQNMTKNLRQKAGLWQCVVQRIIVTS